MLEIASKCTWIGEITLQIAGKSKLVRFGLWKNYRQRPITLHNAGKCKLDMFALWKKCKQKGNHIEIFQKRGNCQQMHLDRGNYTANCQQIQISQIWTVEKLPAKANHTAYCR